MHDLNLKQGFERLLDLQFVRPAVNLEHHCIVLFVVPDAFFGDKRPSYDLMMLHLSPASLRFFQELLPHR